MAFFLFKTEPSTYSYADLVRDKRAVWDGVSNPVALRHLSTLKKGDTVVIYHTGDEKSAVGIAVAASDAYPDPKDAAAKRTVVDLKPVKRLTRPVALADFRADAVLAGVPMVKMPRLSVSPLTSAQLERLLRLAETRL